ncbi:hypothetical protein SFC11_00855 [Exiguobacterium indicum]|uniref:lipopolysaccharide biosynthesis protein n=1 Tax=Exiguobacterium indicum TaxID=296995 RepID=UPI00398219B1
MSNKKSLVLVLISQIVSLGVNLSKVLVIPFLIGVNSFSYWQLFVFYSSLVGFFQFGINDGIYLRYVGKKINRFSKRMLTSQFKILVGSQICISILLVIISNFLFYGDRLYIFILLSFYLLITGTLAFFWFYYQAANEIKKYVRIIMIEKIMFLFISFLFFISEESVDFYTFIFSEIISKTIVLLVCLYLERDIWNYEKKIPPHAFNELKKNMSAGLNLMLANISSMLIIGSFRFVIDLKWTLKDFGEVSFSLTIISMFLILMNSITIVIFPALKTINDSQKKVSFINIESKIDLLFPLLILIYFPMKNILIHAFEDYHASILYLSILYPIIYLEMKNQLLISTFYKVLRKEKDLLKVNLLSLIISFVCSIIVYIFIENLKISLMLILLCVTAKYLLGTIYFKIYFCEVKIKIILYCVLNILSIIGVCIFIRNETMVSFSLSIIFSLLPLMNRLKIKKRNEAII